MKAEFDVVEVLKLVDSVISKSMTLDHGKRWYCSDCGKTWSSYDFEHESNHGKDCLVSTAGKIKDRFKGTTFSEEDLKGLEG